MWEQKEKQQKNKQEMWQEEVNLLKMGRSGAEFKNIVLIFLLLSIGCVTTGPPLIRADLERIRKELEVKALKYKLIQEKKVCEVGYRLISSLPKKDRRGSYPYLGARFIKIDDKVKRAFSLMRDRGIAVAFVCSNSPAEKAGLRAGDIITAIGRYKVYDYYTLRKALRILHPNHNVIFEIERNGQMQELLINVGELPLDVRFKMVDQQEVNAGVTPNAVLVTYGLMRFIKSEDELAIILGHELAHITQGHLAKRFGTDLLSLIIGIALGYGAESISSGSGDIVMQGVAQAFSASFSREFEREADFYGIIYAHRAGFDISAGIEVWERFAIEVPKSMVRNFFSTHPTSVERLLRIRKIVSNIEKGEKEQ